jgi:predicted Zn-dependent protease
MKVLVSVFISFILLVSSSLYAANEQGGQYKNLGNWQVHYIAFPSTFLQPSIAKNYNIERSNYNAVINISVLDKTSKKAQKVSLSGVAKNLVGQSKKLKFKEIVDGESVYYIATLTYSNEETFRFYLDVRSGNKSERLSFHQKFYVD